MEKLNREMKQIEIHLNFNGNCMLNKKTISFKKWGFICLICATSCVEKAQKEDSSASGTHLYATPSGEKFYSTGDFTGNRKDSVEEGLWHYTRLNNPMVLFGQYSNGSIVGEWKFVLDDGVVYSSNWSPYINNKLKLSFSLPFTFQETILDSSYFRLSTLNDSLGKVSIIVGARGEVINSDELNEFGAQAEVDLIEKGYTFTSKKKRIKISGSDYFFAEYFMKDTMGKDVKLYNIYGYSPSKRHFIEFTLFHDGPKGDLVKIIFNFLVTSLYINDERFYNPYLN